MKLSVLKEFASISEEEFSSLWNGLNWTYIAGNRREYYVNTIGATYTYGSGRGVRTYYPQPETELLTCLRSLVEDYFETSFEGCVLNGYENERDSLGWHSDDSHEMDAERPIVILSFGQERKIQFRRIGEKGVEEFTLPHGSLLYMPKGFQQEFQHRIPKGGHSMNERISLTYRGWKSTADGKIELC